MVIECPHCLTRFRLDEKRLSSKRSLLKCSRCQHVFAAPMRPSGPPSPPRKSVPPEQDSFSFSFDDDDDWRQDPASGDEIQEEQFLLNGEVSEAAHPDFDDQRPPARPTAGAKSAAIGDEDDLTVDDEEEQEEDESEEPAGSISLRPVFVFLFLVVAAYYLLARSLYADPEWARQIFTKVPLLGADSGSGTLSRNVVIRQVEARYESSKEGAPVLVVTGRAHNETASPLGSIQIETRLFDEADNAIAEQVGFCGNSVRLELIRDLTVRQIAVLKGLKPPQRFTIQPGEDCAFVTLFTDLPAHPATFTTEVAATQAQA